jgi:hypothetical protein
MAFNEETHGDRATTSVACILELPGLNLASETRYHDTGS